MPGGRFFGAVFFLALSVAAVSSLIAMLELGVRLFMDAGLGRRQSLAFVGIMAFLFGIPSALWMPFFDNQDWVWGVGLMVSGVFIAYAALAHGVDRFRRECINAHGSDWQVGRWFNGVVAVVIPLEFAAMLGWWFFQSATRFDPDGWWNPFRVSSVGTCVVQWGLILGLLFVFNARLARWSQA
jgi:NSS family neurotransmitter:Na+ symporter